jgi:2,4-dienoyl-CoA reductase-like NADH-dependent reductase (Old Yellow Enzyme family)
LFDQFHHSNINIRDDAYGGTLEKRCAFTLETVDKLCSAIGAGRLGVRLSPFGFFNGTDGEDRMAQWIYLCEQLSARGVAYV